MRENDQFVMFSSMIYMGGTLQLLIISQNLVGPSKMWRTMEAVQLCSVAIPEGLTTIAGRIFGESFTDRALCSSSWPWGNQMTDKKGHEWF